jgi:dienelactone hydrolase
VLSFNQLLARAASGVDVAAVRLLQEIARRAAGPALSHLERLAKLQESARAYAAIAPAALFAQPPPLERIAERRVRRLPGGGEVIDLHWHSGYVPHEPGGRDAYLQYVENHTAYARLLRHAQPRPALVCLHGYRAGVHAFEEIAWSARWFYALGLDVALLTLPFHALRAPRSAPGPLFPSTRVGRTIEGFGQAVWDLRRLLEWLRRKGAPMAGIAGMSLGGYTAALASTVEASLDYAVLFIPLGDLTDVAVEHEALRGEQVPPWITDAGKRALALVRPLQRAPLVPGHRMLVVAAEGDRITHTATHAQKLAAHFQAPLVTFPGAHLVQLGRRVGFVAMAQLLARLGAIPPRR